MTEHFAHVWNDKHFVDFEIQVENDVIACHKIIVAAQSPVLRRMMKSDMKEGKENCVTLKNLSAPAIRIIMEYMYTGKFSCPPNVLLDVVKACDFLELITLRDLCREKVISIITPDNVIGWFRLTTLLDMTEIIRACKRIICSSFSKVAQAAEFLSMTSSEINYCITLASSRKVSSDDLARAVLCWINADLIEREKHCEELMELIKLEKCSDAFMSSAMDDFSEVFKTNRSFFRVYIQCKAGRGKAAASENYENLSLIIVDKSHSHTLSKQNEDNEFVKLASIPEEVCYDIDYSVCQYDDIGIVVSGVTNEDTCMMFNLDQQKWKPIKKLKTTRVGHASICVDGVLMLIGGCNRGNNWQRSMDQLALESHDDDDDGQDWKAGPDMPKYVLSPKVTKLKTDVFVIGTKGRLLHLDTKRGEWKQKPTCPVKIAKKHDNYYEFSVAAGNGKVYVAGGAYLVNCVYTVETESWVTARAIDCWPWYLHYDGTLVFKHDKLLLLGGCWGEKVKEYDTNEDVWKRLDYNCQCYNAHAFAVDMFEDI